MFSVLSSIWFISGLMLIKHFIGVFIVYLCDDISLVHSDRLLAGALMRCARRRGIMHANEHDHCIMHVNEHCSRACVK